MKGEKESTSVNKTRKFTIRFDPGEYDKIEQQFKQTSLKKMSEFIRKVLTDSKIKVHYHNKSMDDFIEIVAYLNRELNAIGNNLNQATRKINTCQSASELKGMLPEYWSIQQELMSKIEEIKRQFNEISDKWFQYSTAGTE